MQENGIVIAEISVLLNFLDITIVYLLYTQIYLVTYIFIVMYAKMLTRSRSFCFCSRVLYSIVTVCLCVYKYTNIWRIVLFEVQHTFNSYSSWKVSVKQRTTTNTKNHTFRKEEATEPSTANETHWNEKCGKTELNIFSGIKNNNSFTRRVAFTERDPLNACKSAQQRNTHRQRNRENRAGTKVRAKQRWTSER